MAESQSASLLVLHSLICLQVGESIVIRITKPPSRPFDRRPKSKFRSMCRRYVARCFIGVPHQFICHSISTSSAELSLLKFACYWMKWASFGKSAGLYNCMSLLTEEVPSTDSVYSELAYLFEVRSKYEPNGIFNQDWHPTTGPFAPQAQPPPPPPPPAEPEPPRPSAWHQANPPKGSRISKKGGTGKKAKEAAAAATAPTPAAPPVAPAGPRAQVASWSTWQGKHQCITG